ETCRRLSPLVDLACCREHLAVGRDGPLARQRLVTFELAEPLLDRIVTELDVIEPATQQPLARAGPQLLDHLQGQPAGAALTLRVLRESEQRVGVDTLAATVQLCVGDAVERGA